MRAPGGRAARAALVLAIAVAVAAILWTLVFPWIDRTFVNRPALEDGALAASAPR